MKAVSVRGRQRLGVENGHGAFHANGALDPEGRATSGGLLVKKLTRKRKRRASQSLLG